ncbi:MAG TPA: type II toxin-antitoxin system VapC family toxin [Thermoanaerobaculia bacterium]|nr:type II toxin-antitoxin system VapC family toxin [Thermoanaerobaculia bacterium]
MAELREGVLFLDANVLMYAAGKDHPYREPCREVLRRIETEDLLVVTNVEVLQELLHRYRSLGQPDLATAIYKATKDLCEEVLSVTEDDLDHAHEILQAAATINARDAVHAATALRRGVQGILSTDRHFDELAGLNRFDPMELVS